MHIQDDKKFETGQRFLTATGKGSEGRDERFSILFFENLEVVFYVQGACHSPNTSPTIILNRVAYV